MIRSLFITLLVVLTHISFAQYEMPYSELNPSTPAWAQEMYKDQPDVGLVIDMYKSYYKANPFVRTKHTQFYKRWIRSQSHDVHGWRTGVYTNAEKQILKTQERNYVEHSLHIQDPVNRGPMSPWVAVGPFDWDHDAASRSYAPGAAHVYTVEQCLGNQDVMYAGTATAGIWKSTDRGANWQSLSSNLMVNQVYAIEINHTNPNTVYASMFSSIYKTVDGGQNWLPTGDATFQGLTINVRDIRMFPTDTNKVFAATSAGLLSSTDGGNNWTTIVSGSFQEIEFHPTIGSIMYAVMVTGNKTEFYKSTDSGASFVHKPNGWPVPTAPNEQERAEIAVSPASPHKIYALLTGVENGSSGLYGIYTSTDTGENWSFTCCGPSPGGTPDSTTVPPNYNMMAWSDDGLDEGGQYYYDLALAVSPTNADSLWVCGVNMWVSGNGGAWFKCPSKWSHPDKPDYVHADIHDMHYNANGEMWVACDGGIFKSTNNGLSFDRSMNGISGTDFWGFSTGFWDGDVMIGGAYHNGTLIKNGSTYINDWLCTDGGDGVGGFVNFGKEKTVYSWFNKKELVSDRTVTIPTVSYDKMPNSTYIIGQSSQIEFDPRCFNIYYNGNGTGLWKTEDDGSSFTLIHDFGEDVADVEVSWANPDVIYVSTWPGYWNNKKIYKTTDGGSNWTEITPSTAVIPSSRWIAYDLELDPENEDNLWLARVAQSSTNYDGNKVYYSSDGGSSWTNITTATLDGEQLTNIVHQAGTDGGVYIGTRRAVYYRNATMLDWDLFNVDLPLSTLSRRLVPHYRTGKLRNGTNRSVWEVEFYETSTPIAQISADKLNVQCSRDTVQFYDHSTLNETGASWSWSFPGASWVSSTTSRTPKVVYNTSGTYDVSLTVTDNLGSDSQTLNSFITMSNECAADSVPGMALQCNAAGDYATTPDLNLNTNVLTISAWIKPNGIQPNYSGIVMNDGDAAGFNFTQGNNTVGYHWPGGQWWWNSGLIAPDGEWSHVAMVATASSMTIYVNGIASVQNITLNATDISTMKIGSYKGWNSRNYVGLIDEVCIWNTALTQSEIRELMHLTKNRQSEIGNPLYDNNLIAYYQFNENSGSALDRKGIYHATIAGTAGRTTSTAPVGGGQSSTMSVTGSGAVAFNGTGVEMTFPSSGTYPDGDVVVSRINVDPDQKPNGNPSSNGYWIFNNYGTNSSFTELDQLSLSNAGEVGNPCDAYYMYKRNSRDEGSTWGGSLDAADNCTPGGINGGLVFNTGNGITSFSQFITMNDGGAVLPVELLSFNAAVYQTWDAKLTWTTQIEVNNNRFDIEHSMDGNNFSWIGSVPTQASNSNTPLDYEFIDVNAQQGTNYYRLKMIDNDSSFEYSDVKSVTINELPSAFVVVPNPIEGDFMEIITQIEGAYDLVLYDIGGKKVLSDTFEGNQSLDLTGFSKGTYVYRIQTAEQKFYGKLLLQ